MGEVVTTRTRKASPTTSMPRSNVAPAPTRIGALPARIAAGKALRNKVPRKDHGAWRAPTRRADPVNVLIASSEGRLPELLPIRYGRMMASPFAFYRGAAAIMAADLAHTPVTGIRVQACGDCHLLNFGGFATPERRTIFGLNDFDETLPAPWEWDVKRLAASFVIASRNSRFSRADAKDTALACARSYREHMAEYARMRALDVWYSCIDGKAVLDLFAGTAAVARIKQRMVKERKRNDAEHTFPALTEVSHGVVRIHDDPPLIYHPQEKDRAVFQANLRETFARYRESLADDRRQLIDRYVPTDLAAKVVGIGSVGTWCGIMLMMARADDPLFLQVKEARTSVLEPFAGATVYANRGRRVVMGQRLMQAASDVFLGWTEGAGGRHFYVRQLREMKVKPLPEVFTPPEMEAYAELCGWALARSHARSGDAAKISGYLGATDRMDRALATFAVAYADQNERDHAALLAAIRAGKIEAQTG